MPLAANLRAEAAAEEHERAEIKRLTLRANADLDLVGARPGPLKPNLNPRFAPVEPVASAPSRGSGGGRGGGGGGAGGRRLGHKRGGQS